jgi:hypothetical protein
MTERQKVQHKETSYNNFQGKTGRGEKESKKKKFLFVFFLERLVILGSSRAEQRASTHNSRERDREKIFSISLSRSP